MPPAPVRARADLHPDDLLDEAALRRAGARAAGVREADVRAVTIAHRSIDARRGKVRVHAELLVYVGKDMPEQPADIAPEPLPTLRGEPQVAIVGAGPAGMFCAWGLARAGVRAVVLERGRAVRQRRHDLAGLSQRGELDPESNYCFGEGGAGTFSDGKLYTRSSKRGPVDLVLRTFTGYGAPTEILVDARPHIGTNRLPKVITAMREHLIAAGVEFRFEARADQLMVRDGAAAGVALRGGETIPARAVVVAPGHSARDVQAWLRSAGVQLSFKSFALGVRIEHPQSLIDRLQYGALAGHPALGAAAYRLVEQTGAGAAFSFCMCPGGYIVPAATDPGMQVVNGMSPHSRRGKFANSGWVTEVGPHHLAAAGLDPEKDPLAGVTYQGRFEAAAYAAGGEHFVAPAQTLADFVAGRLSRDLPECSYHRGLRSARLDQLLGPLAPPLQAALRALGERMPGFVGDQAVAVGVESRTSCPVRVDRDHETLQSPSTPNLYPCGEGAGFAGGIVSAALDGLRVATAIARHLSA
jgi:uncharacterized FAD-dependent dehydrogenase